MIDSADAIDVLHVDDETNLVDLTATFLEREDARMRVQTATSADEGLELLAENPVDCIVSDCDMPVKNGIDFLEAVREDHPDIPFILFTGKGSEEIASDAISAGVSDYLQKEAGLDQYVVLANRIENLVSRQRAQADLESRIEQQQNAARRREYHRDVLLELATPSGPTGRSMPSTPARTRAPRSWPRPISMSTTSEPCWMPPSGWKERRSGSSVTST